MSRYVKHHLERSRCTDFFLQAILNVTAYGKQVYTKTFNPCAADTLVQQLCPGTFQLFT